MKIAMRYKGIVLPLLFSGLSIAAWAQDKPTAAPAIKTFALQSNISGAASNSVNLYTGDVALPVNIVSLPGHNGLDVNVSISYGNSGLQNTVSTWNQEAPAGILGLGWNMDVPKIVADHKQTGTREDDEYYLVEGGSSNKLIRTTSGSDANGSYYGYETKNYQFWKVLYYYDITELYGMSGYGSGPNKWVITKEDGTQYVYGDKNSGRNTVQWIVRWNNWIGNSAQTTNQSQLAYVWNLSEIINMWNEKITFEYENVEQFVGSPAGQKHTEASYLKEITDVFGRKVKFFYNERDPQYYAELHTEQAEPDAYQEYYELKYLNRLELFLETGSKFLSVDFAYTSLNEGTNKAKMLLSSITQKNAAGQALPNMRFNYITSGSTAGYLQTITYPTGGTISYTYTPKVVGHSNREFTAYAPPGFAEPKVWVAEDYVVVCWRQLGSGHDINAREVKLYIYTWVGEWKEKFQQTISHVYLDNSGGPNFRDYKDFQVAIERDFFGILVPAINNYYHLFILYKDDNQRAGWGNHTTTIDYGPGLPTLMSGTHFIAVGSSQDDGTHPSHRYVFQGNSWRDDIINQTVGEHYYTSANNWFISHNRAGFDGYPEINFNYLTEDKKWVTKSWGSWLEFSSSSPSYWYASNSFAQVMAHGHPEWVYRWDLTYTNFFRDATDRNGNALFGGLTDTRPVNIINNSMVGVDGRLIRWDGKEWAGDNITSSHNSPFGMYFSYGDDFVVRPTQYVGSGLYRGARKVFNPNTLQWLADHVHDGADRGQDFANAGIDYYYFGNGYYYRQPNGTWVKKITYSLSQSQFATGGYPRFDVLWGIYPFPVFEMRAFKNGEISNPFYFGGNLMYNKVKFKSTGVGNQTIITYPSNFSHIEDATSITLKRFVNDDIWSYQMDYPVTMVTAFDGTTSRYTTIDYNTSTAAMDVSGNVANYHEVTVIPGSTTASSKPHGYTKTYFYNGLDYAELGVPYMATNLLWSGMPYQTQVYDNNNQLLSSSKTTFNVHTKDIFNGDGTKVMAGRYVRPYESISMNDGVETVTQQWYDANTGMVNESITYDHNSKNDGIIRTRYKYFWEQYNPTRDKNILSPVIQTQKSIFKYGVGETMSEVTAVTWKTWNNVYAPHKTYQWKRTGSSTFDFAIWSGTGEPPLANWGKLHQIDAVDAVGNVIQQSTR
jgi:hypothetical protein